MIQENMSGNMRIKQFIRIALVVLELMLMVFWVISGINADIPSKINTWTGNNSNEWDDKLNWSLGIPKQNHHALISYVENHVRHGTTSFSTINSITCNGELEMMFGQVEPLRGGYIRCCIVNGGALKVGQSNELRIGEIICNTGSIAGLGSMSIENKMTIDDVCGIGIVVWNLNNYRTADWKQGTIAMVRQVCEVNFNNCAGASFNIECGGTIAEQGEAFINNQGEFGKFRTHGETRIVPDFTNYAAGILRVGAGISRLLI